MAAKKLEGLCENTRGSRAVFGFRKGDEIGIDLIDFNWAARRGERPIPIIQMDDGSELAADKIPGFLGVEMGPVKRSDEDQIVKDWFKRVEKFELPIPDRDDDDDDDDEDDEEDEDGTSVDDDDDDDDEQPVRVRPRRR